MISIRCNGLNLSPWQSVAITESVETAIHGWSASGGNVPTFDRIVMPVRPLDRVEIFETGSVVLRGYCDKISGRLSGSENGVTFSGRSLGCDIVDCSADPKYSEMSGADALRIAVAMCEGLPIRANVAPGVDLGAVFGKYSISPGETRFSAINRAIRARGLLLSTDPESGDLWIVKPGSRPADDSLVEGQNILDISLDWDFSTRGSEYHVIGAGVPDPGRSRRPSARVESVATDSEINRFRPIWIQSDKSTDSAEAAVVARFEASRRAGQSCAVSVSVGSWRQSTGRIWMANETIMLNCPSLGIWNEKYLISEKTIRYSVSAGERCDLKLVHPDTYSIPDFSEIQRGRVASAPLKRSAPASVPGSGQFVRLRVDLDNGIGEWVPE